MTHLAPSSILFSHSKIRPRFTGCGKTLEETYQEIKSGSVSGNPPPDLPSRTFTPALMLYSRSRIAASHPRLVRRQRVRVHHLPTACFCNTLSMYVSENNRRLFVFKRLESEVVHAPARAPIPHPARPQGVLQTVPVRIERVKALTKTYVSEARIERERVKPAAAACDSTQNESCS